MPPTKASSTLINLHVFGFESCTELPGNTALCGWHLVHRYTSWRGRAMLRWFMRRYAESRGMRELSLPLYTTKCKYHQDTTRGQRRVMRLRSVCACVFLKALALLTSHNRTSQGWLVQRPWIKHFWKCFHWSTKPCKIPFFHSKPGIIMLFRERKKWNLKELFLFIKKFVPKKIIFHYFLERSESSVIFWKFN